MAQFVEGICAPNSVLVAGVGTKVLDTGLRIDKNSSGINYALAFVYLQNKQTQKAREYSIILKRLEPTNPDYQQFFSALGVNQ